MKFTQKMIWPVLTLLALPFLSAAFCPVRLWAANPLTPEAYYADLEPHVWKDGKITLYGSHDINQTQYCSDNYHFLTSSDLVHWTDPGIAFTIKDMPPGSGSLLYACDCAFRDGKYYLYIFTDNGTLGVATSASPTGPFSPAQRVGGLPDRPGIDPAVFIDDDGQAYPVLGPGRQCTRGQAQADHDRGGPGDHHAAVETRRGEFS